MSAAAPTQRFTLYFGFVSRWPPRLICVAICATALVASSIASASAPLSAFQKGPYLQDLGPSGVTIRAELAVAAPAVIELREAGALGDAGVARDHAKAGKPIVVRAAASTFHSIHVDGLEPKTHYTYEIQSGGSTQKGEFTTAPKQDSTEPFSFSIYGDNRTDEVAHAAVVRAIMGTTTDFLVHTGDFVEDGSNAADWQTFFDVEAPLLRDRGIFACVGNHELIGGGGANYLRYFGPVEKSADASGEGAKPMLHGSFRWGNTRFFLLNAMDAWDSAGERTWLDAELARADKEQGLTWRIVVLHHSPWSAGPHGGNPRMLRAGIPATLAKHKIDLVVGGHDHIYERGFADGLRYVISGGGGAPLYPIDHPLPSTRKFESVHHVVEATVSAESVALVVNRLDGTLLEKCAFDKSSADWSCDPKTPAAPAAAPPTAVDPPRASASRCGCRAAGARGEAGESGEPAALAFFGLALASLGLRRRVRPV